MKFVDEFRLPHTAKATARAIAERVTRPWNIMEVCGGQTHSIVRHGLENLLPENVHLLHGPGCPVCVTPIEVIDQAMDLAARDGVIFCSFGDMLRVPGSKHDLLQTRALGADVRIVYSPLDAVTLARKNPDREVVFFAVGFETTAPANAMAVHQAAQQGLENFSVLVSQVRVPPALNTLLANKHCNIHGLLAAGHVCTIMGISEYQPIAQAFNVPIVVTGFEPVDILHGIHHCLIQLEEGRSEVENSYGRVVQNHGNLHAQHLMQQVFETAQQRWRGLGNIDHSGLVLRTEYAAFDAALRFGLQNRNAVEPPDCISGLVLQGLKKPLECPAFATRCTPQNPLGATMVSSEGACAAYFRYRQRDEAACPTISP